MTGPAAGSRRPAPSYTNPGGTGNRAALITVSSGVAIDFGVIGSAIDGVTTDGSGFTYTNSQPATGAEMVKFDFGAGKSKVINEVKIYLHGGGGAGTLGVWKLQGSHNDSVWVDVGTNISPVGGGADLTDTSPSANIIGYRYYRYVGVSGTTAGASRSVIDEFEFKIDNA